MNIWTILNVKPTTGTTAIKKAYAKLAAKCHIEKDPKGFQKLHEAYAEAMEIAKEREKKLPQQIKEQAESKPRVFRAVPKKLHKLSLAEPINEEKPGAQEELGAQEEPVAQKGLGAQEDYGQPEPHAEQFCPPESVDGKPEGAESQNRGFNFQQGGAPEVPAAENTAQHTGEYQFPKEGSFRPVALENEGTEGASGYVFPLLVGKHDESLPREGAPHQDPPKQEAVYSFPQASAAEVSAAENAAQQADEYQFPKSRPDAYPPSAQGAPLRGYPTASSGAMIFPGIFPLDGMDIPIMPLPLDFSEEYFPQTKEAADRLTLLENARNRCLEDMQGLLERRAPEQAWYPVLLGADFSLVQYSGKFLLSLQNLCLEQLPLEMASALYTAYGFASNKSLRQYPVTAALHRLLNTVLGLPQEDIPLLSLSEILHRSDRVLGGLSRLCEVCREPYICGQALRAQAFTRLQHQPYFLLKLVAFLETNNIPEEWREALARAYQFRETQASPCLQALAEQLPRLKETPKETPKETLMSADYNPAADSLLLDASSLDAFYAAARENILELLHKTRKAFPQSTRRTPWEYVFTHPEFTLVRRDVQFLIELQDFLKKENWPAGIWPTLTDFYAADFAELPVKEVTIQEPLAELAVEEQITACLMMLRHIVERSQDASPKNPSFWKVITSMLRLV